MKKIRFIQSILLGLITAALIAVPIADFLQVNPVIPGAVLFFAPLTIKLCVTARLGFMPSQAAFGFMAIQKETWVDYIIENLWKDNDFINQCYDESNSVLNGSVVHIPQAGAKPTVVKNRSSLPATVVQRTDTDITYTLDNYTTDPSLVQNVEEIETSYAKMDSVFGEHLVALRESIAEELLYKWAPTVAGQITRTTGATADAIALAPGATGTRKPLTLLDLRLVKSRMNKAGISKLNRFAIIPEDMLTQLMADPAMTAPQLQMLMDLKEGTVARLEGFTIITRANATIYDNTGTPVPKLISAATAVTDNLAVLCYQKDCVAKALGTVDVFEASKDPQYYGDIVSALLRCGGRKRRSGGEGVNAIIQTT